MTNVSIFSPHEQSDSLKSWLKQPQSYLKSQKIEIEFNLEILFYVVFVGKLKKLHLFKSRCLEMFCK